MSIQTGGSPLYQFPLPQQPASYVYRTFMPPQNLYSSSDSMLLTPSLSSIEFITEPNSIIPPTMTKVNIPSLIGDTSLLVQSDIFVPSFSVYPDVSSLKIPLALINDVCDTPVIKETVTKIFYYKLLDKWLYDNDDAGYILGYLKVIDGKVELIKDIDKKDDYKANTQDIVDKKVDYIEDKIIKIDDILAILKKFVEGTHISWCELPKNSFFVKEAIEKTLERKLKRLITSK